MSVDTDTLESMCELVIDCPHFTPKWTDSGYIVLRNQNIKNGILDLNSPSFTHKEDFKRRNKRVTPKAGDIVFTREAPMGEVCMIPDGLECCLGQRQVLLRPKDDVCGQYLFWALQSPFVQHQISWNEGTGSTVSNVRIPVLKALNIPRHPKKEAEIAKLLSDLADKIQLNRQTNQTLENIAQAIFKSWFVDFDPTRAKAQVRASVAEGRMPGSEQALPDGFSKEDEERLAERAAMAAIAGKPLDQLDTLSNKQLETLKTTAAHFPDKLVESELGEIPEGWVVKNIDGIVKRLKPKKRYTKKQVESVGSIPVYEQGAGILLGYHNDEAGFSASPEEPLFIFGDHTCVVHLSCESFDISQNVIPLAGKGYPTPWVYYAIQGKQEFQEYRRHWSEFVIKEVVAPLPNVAIAYSDFVTSLYKQKEQIIRENATIEQLRDTLLPKLLSGELSIKPEAAA